LADGLMLVFQHLVKWLAGPGRTIGPLDE